MAPESARAVSTKLFEPLPARDDSTSWSSQPEPGSSLSGFGSSEPAHGSLVALKITCVLGGNIHAKSCCPALIEYRLGGVRDLTEGEGVHRYRTGADRYGKRIFAAAAATACSGRRS